MPTMIRFGHWRPEALDIGNQDQDLGDADGNVPTHDPEYLRLRELAEEISRMQVVGHEGMESIELILQDYIDFLADLGSSLHQSDEAWEDIDDEDGFLDHISLGISGCVIVRVDHIPSRNDHTQALLRRYRPALSVGRVGRHSRNTCWPGGLAESASDKCHCLSALAVLVHR